MSWRILLPVKLVIVLVLAVVAEPKEDNTVKDVKREEIFNDVLKVVTRHCVYQTSSECVKLQFLTLVDHLLPSSGLQVVPGMYLTWQDVPIDTLPSRHFVSDPTGRQMDSNLKEVNNLLGNRMFKQLSSWSLKVSVFGNETLQRLRNIFDLFLESDQQRGFRKDKGFHGMWKYLGSVMMTLMFSAFSALITKSLTVSTIALLLSMMGLFRGMGGGGGDTYHEPPMPAYRSPAVYALPPLPSAPVAAAIVPAAGSPEQYGDNTEDPNAVVYVNRKSWKPGRSEDYEKYLRNYYYL